MLLRGAPDPPPSGRLLDLGCGSGVLALTLARRSPAAQVIAVDVNERALELTARNAEHNGLANITVGTPDAIDAEARYELIWSNPPIRVGKQALHELLSTWLDRLTATGEAIIVIQKNLGADSLQRWLTDNGWPAERLSSSKGYRLLRVRPRVR